MFTRAFGQMLAGSAQGNAPVLARPITWNAGLVEHHGVPLNTIFATIQLLPGLGIAIRPTVRVALAGSIALAGALTPSLATMPEVAWAVVFAVLTGWLGGQAGRAVRASGIRALAGGQCAPSLVHAAAMLYMSLTVAGHSTSRTVVPMIVTVWSLASRHDAGAARRGFS
jgi:hypothetical protein